MTKVFHIITSLDLGGAERVAINIAKSQNKEIEYHIVEVIRGHSAFTKQLINELETNGIKYHRSFFPVLFHFHYLFERIAACLFPIQFLYLLLRYRPNIIHSHTEIPDMAIWISLKLMPWTDVKIVRTIHNTKLWTGMEFVGPQVEFFMQQRNANISISKYVEQAYYNCYNKHSVIIHNGIKVAPQIAFEGLKKEKINICFAGRFEEQKGISILCQIIKELQGNNKYYFHIFGSGCLKYLIDELKQCSNVDIHPPLHGISTYLSSFDYLIMPSLHEGLSILALEASFNRLPVMINHCAGLYDTLPSEWPLVVHDNNIGQWLHLFNDVLPTLDCNSLKNEAYDFVKANFSVEKMQREYEELYKETLTK